MKSHARRRSSPAALLLLLGLACAPWRAHAQAAAPISVELNKLEPLAANPAAAEPGAGCRVYIVVVNPEPEAITQLRLDLILFGADEVIARRVALDLAPLGPRKKAVRLFDLAGQPCTGIGRVLVNDVLACQVGGDSAPQDQQRQACLDRLLLSSRAKAELAK